MWAWLTHLEHQWRSLAWRPWLDTFTSEYKVLRHDPRGCGLSDRTAGDLSFETWVRDLECVVERGRLPAVCLVGTCWGGPIAIEYAVRHPERVSRLILLRQHMHAAYCSGTLRPDASGEGADMERLSRGSGGVRRTTTSCGYGLELSAWRVAGPYTLLVRSAAGRDLRRYCHPTCFDIGRNIDVREAARKIKCPVLIVHPERDRSVANRRGPIACGL